MFLAEETFRRVHFKDIETSLRVNPGYVVIANETSEHHPALSGSFI